MIDVYREPQFFGGTDSAKKSLDALKINLGLSDGFVVKRSRSENRDNEEIKSRRLAK